MFSTIGYSSSAIFAWPWPSRVRWPDSLMMIWNTPAIAMPCSLATSVETAVVSLMTRARAAAWRQPVDGRADGRQVAELAAPELRRDVADPGDGLENEVADSSCRGNGVRPGADQVAQPILNLLLAISNQLLLSRKVVVDGLLGDLGLACHVSDGNVLIAALGEQAGRGVGDEPAGPRLLEIAQSGGSHPSSVTERSKFVPGSKN